MTFRDEPNAAQGKTMPTDVIYVDRRTSKALGPKLTLAGAGVVIVAAVLLTASKLFVALILPVISMLSLTIGFSLALAYWKLPSSSKLFTFRDAGAMLVFIGFAAALLSDASRLAALYDTIAW